MEGIVTRTDPDYDVPCDEACQLAKEGAAAQSPYRFPATRWVGRRADITEQTRKVIDEANEAFYDANNGKSLNSIALELLDTIQAAETGLRILELRGVCVSDRRDEVEEKNRARGYYGGV